jgi:tetratricopeptide (TPR) repeat protein
MTTLPRIKLQWAASATTPGDWYLGLFGHYNRPGGRGRGLAISLRGALLWCLAASVAGYFAVAGYVLYRLEQKPYNFVRYSDLLLYPVRYTQVEELRGQAMIAMGFDDLKQNNWQQGVMKLRIGLDKYPRDLKARLEVARFFVAAKIRNKAQETLLDGLAQGYPGRVYLESAISVVGAGEDYELVINICEKALALATDSTPVADRRWLVEQKLRALLAEQRSDEALTYLDTLTGETDSANLSELRALALLQSKRIDEAVTYSEAWSRRSPDNAQALRIQARVYREAGRMADMNKVLNFLREQNPAEPRIRAYGIVQNLLAGEEQRGRELIEDYIFRFGGTPANLILLAEPLADAKRPAELEIVLAAAAERGVTDIKLETAKLQVAMNERDWVESRHLIEGLRIQLKNDTTGRAGLLEFFGNLVAAAADPADGAQTNLTNYIALRQLPMSMYRQSIVLLRQAGRPQTAREVVRLAQGVFPSNRYLVTARDELETELQAARAAADAARPDKQLAADFVTPARFYAALDRLVASEGGERGLLMLRELRKAAPAWTAGAGEPLARRELDLQAQGGDVVELQAAARRYVNEDKIRLANAIAVSTRLYEAGRPSDARIVLEEILRRVPEHPPAVALKTKWFPPVPAAGEPAMAAPAKS